MTRTPPVVVLTGGIASGKTTVSNRFAQLGVEVIDTDVIARQLTEPGQPGYDAIIAEWGTAVLEADTSALDRALLRKMIFSEPTMKQTLENILHPLIFDEVKAQVQACAQRSDMPYVVVVIPLYAESQRKWEADAIVVVDTPECTQHKRLTARDAIDDALARQMIHAQATRQERIALATDIIENTGELADLNEAVDSLHEKLLDRFAVPQN